ncbi:hypothetical protein [Stutzerimonas kunmingensis]|uniref:hypothetical protein n=1 Tax=Stutzerimonas kunmingensis TaxID=1211807 RepID=UPI002FC72206
MSIRPLYLPGAILVVALAFYFANFNDGFSHDQSVWGAFGDFLGGVLNPVLTFTTVYLLIQSLNTQNKTLSHSELQLTEAKNTFTLQQKTEKIKQFESLFFVFTEIASRTYSSFSIFGENNREIYGHEAVTFITQKIFGAVSKKENPADVFENLDESNHNSIYGVSQAYCSLFKLIDEFCPDDEKAKYTSVAVSLMPAKVIHLICMAEAYTRWPIIDSARKLGFFDKPAMVGLLSRLSVKN